MTTPYIPEGPLDTPYKRARQEWDARMGTAVVQAKNWRLATFASLSAVLVSLLGLIYLGAQPKAVPHVIEVDRLGAATYRGPVTSESYVPSDAVITYELRRFVSDTRELSSDVAVAKRNWLDAYTLLTPRGCNMLSAFVATLPGHNPYSRIEDERITVEFLSAVRVVGDTWQVDWRESRWDRGGSLLAPPETWRAMLKTVLLPPKTPEDMTKNPIGLFVDEFHWDRVGGER